MRYARILALIDAEVDRLQRARQLLASTYTASSPAPKKTQRRTAPASARPVTVDEAISKEPSTPPQNTVRPATPVLPKRLKPVTRRERTVVVKPAAEASAKALGGAVPVTPVFVSAEQVRQAQLQKQQEQATEQGAVSPATSDSLTAEVLKQKWLHPSAS
jgi:hypothetical protein